MKLRTQLTIVITAFVAVLVAAAGLVVVLRDDHRDRDDIDSALKTQAAAVQTTSALSGALPSTPGYVVRLIADGKVRSASGPAAEFPLPVGDGLTNVRANGSNWRSEVTTLKTGAQLQVLTSLAGAKSRHDSNVLVVDLMIAIAVLLTAAGAWWLTGLIPAGASSSPAPTVSPALSDTAAASPAGAPRDSPAGAPRDSPAGAPREQDRLPEVASREQDRLPAFVGAVRALRPGQRLPETGDSDAAGLAAVINVLLDRIETAPAAAVPAAAVPADSGVPADQFRAELEKLLDNPEMPATQRHLILAAMLDVVNLSSPPRFS